MHQRQHVLCRGGERTNELDYNIIGTGSTGNAVRIENIMFDCGVAFSHMKEDLYKVDTLLITHAHSDHIKPSTFERIRKEFPMLKIFANADVAYQYEVDKVVGTCPFKLKGGRRVIPFDGVHDVPVTGYIVQMKDMNILYMTDTAKVRLPEEIPLDYMFLESNFDERKLKEQSKKYKRHGYDPYLSVTRHLSTQKCKEAYYLYRRSQDSVLIELHQSRRFY